MVYENNKSFSELVSKLKVSNLSEEELKDYSNFQLNKLMRSTNSLSEKLKEIENHIEEFSQVELEEIVEQITNLFENQREFINYRFVKEIKPEEI